MYLLLFKEWLELECSISISLSLVASCNVNGEEEAINSFEGENCYDYDLIESRCEEVKPPACPCYDGQDLMAVRKDNVDEGACKIEDNKIKLFNDDGRW